MEIHLANHDFPEAKKTKQSTDFIPGNYSLRGPTAEKLVPGDVFYRTEKIIVKTIIKIEGSDSVDIIGILVKNNWQIHEPN